MSEASTCRIDFEPLGKRVDVQSGATLFDAARLAGIALTTVCGGEGTCGRCRVVVRSGGIAPATESDRGFLSQIELDDGHRLACRTHVSCDLKVDVPRGSLVAEQRLQIDGIERRVAVEAALHAYDVEVAAPTMDDVRSDLARVADMLETTAGLHGVFAQPAVLGDLSEIARRTGWHFQVYVRDREIVGVESQHRPPVGFACDLGTTKIAGYLVDLETGEELAAGAVMNPQIGYGEDVISRLAYAIRRPGGGAELVRVVRESVNALAGSLADRAGVDRTRILEACIVGNTAMMHLFLDLPVRQLATAPFVAAASAALDIKASDVDLDFATGAYVHIPPCISGFVGADHVGMVVASDLDVGNDVVVGVDIGTNTEIGLHKPGGVPLTSTSCASGPAFEGAHIHDGMRAASGAIDAVRSTGSVYVLHTIDDTAPVGLCGSGIVDAIAMLRRLGAINDRGRMQSGVAGVRHTSRGYEFVLAQAEQTGLGRDIVITQQDVNEIQLAKGAVRAGIATLLEATGTSPEEVTRVVIAGAFGSYLHLDSTLDIGLLPRFPNAEYVQVGNAAGMGAKRLLLSLKERQRAQQVARRTRYVELTTASDFKRRFALSMLFPGVAA